MGWALSCHELIAPVLVPVVTGHEQAAERGRRSGPPCPPCCRAAWSTVVGKSGLPMVFVVHRHERADEQDGRHGGEDRPALPLVAGVLPKAYVSEKEQIRMANISSQLVSGVGLSNGCDELALRKPPPLFPSSLIHSCEAIGPIAIVCCAPSKRRHGLRRVPGLRNALPDEDEGADDRDRQQDIEDAAGQVDPVVADRSSNCAE